MPSTVAASNSIFNGCVVMSVSVAQTAAALMMDVGDNLPHGIAEGILFDSVLRGHALFGGLTGALLSLTVFTPGNDSWKNILRRMMLQFASSSMSAMVFAPVVCVSSGFEKTPDNVMCIAGIIGFCIVGLLHKLIPDAEKFWDSVVKPLVVDRLSEKIKSWLPEKKDSNASPSPNSEKPNETRS